MQNSNIPVCKCTDIQRGLAVVANLALSRVTFFLTKHHFTIRQVHAGCLGAAPAQVPHIPAEWQCQAHRLQAHFSCLSRQHIVFGCKVRSHPDVPLNLGKQRRQPCKQDSARRQQTRIEWPSAASGTVLSRAGTRVQQLQLNNATALQFLRRMQHWQWPRKGSYAQGRHSTASPHAAA